MEQRNILLAIVLSLLILLGSQMLLEQMYPSPPPEEEVAEETLGDAMVPGAPAIPGQTDVRPGAAPDQPREEAVADAPRVRIDSARVHGSFSLRGARIDDVTLADYRVSVEPDSPEVVLFSPSESPRAYYAQHGWVPTNPAIETPGPDTVWEASAEVLSPGNPVTLTWTNPQGIEFHRTITLDRDYLFTVEQSVTNSSDETVSLAPYGLVSRSGTPRTSGFFILHEGPIAVADGKLEEFSYSTLQDDGVIELPTVGGWIGITDKYWLAALIPDQQDSVNTRFLHRLDRGTDKYQADYVGTPMTVGPGTSITATTRLFAGAKEVNLLDRYEESLGIPMFDRAVDFGWFYFMTKPIFQALQWFAGLMGNFGLAILALTVVIKIAFFPLANKSYQAMSKMKNLQPEMLKIRERFGDDKQRMNQEMMALYKREKVNPAAGCLPILIQIPVFFALYKVLFVTIEMRHAPFYGWIKDLSAPDPTNIFELFGLIPWGAPDWLHFGVWPLIMGLTMFAQQRLNPQPADPIQAKIFLFMPLIFTIILARFPAGLVIYWTWNNALSIAQQWVIMQRMKKKDARAGTTAHDRTGAAGGAAGAGSGGSEGPGGGNPGEDTGDKAEETSEADGRAATSAGAAASGSASSADAARPNTAKPKSAKPKSGKAKSARPKSAKSGGKARGKQRSRR